MQYPINIFKIPELADIGLPYSMMGNLCLGFYAGMIGGSIIGNLNGKIIIPNLYCLHVGESGTSKSLAFKIFSNPIKKIQQNFLKEQDIFLQNSIAEFKAMKASEMGKELNKNFDLKGEVFTHPVWGRFEAGRFKKFFVTVGTIEGLISNIYYFPFGTLIGYDEAYKFFKDMGRYNRGGESSDIQFYTSAFDGEPFYEVKKHDKDYIMPDHIYLSFVGIINREQLSKVYSRYDDDGFKERFLYSYEEYKCLIILKARDYSIKKINEDFERIHNNKTRQRQIQIPRIVDDAIIDFVKYKDSIANPIWRKYLPKLRTIMERLTLILSIIRGEDITVELVDDVIELAEYHILTYNELFKYEEEDPKSKLTEKSKKMYELLPDKFTFTEAVNINKNHKVFGSKSSLVKLLNNSDLFIKENNTYLKRENL